MYVTARLQDDAYTRIVTGLSPELRRTMDDLLEIPAGERRSPLFQFKEYPPEASNAVILCSIERYYWLRNLRVGDIDLRGMSPPMVRYVADLATRYDAYELRRFARSTKQLIDALEEFRHLGAAFISITEQIDTSSPMGKAMFTVISAIAEFERSLISKRVRSGIAKARATGKRHGRPKIDDQTIQEIQLRRRQGESLEIIARHLRISHQTVANYASPRKHNAKRR